jgi:multidrug efflux system membrane fusion protein
MDNSMAGKDSSQPTRLAPSTDQGLFRRMVPWLFGLLVVGGGAIWWWKAHVADSPVPEGTQANGPANAAPGGGGRRFAGANVVQPVSVQAVRRQDIRVSVDAIGSISALNTAIVRAQVSGVLQSLNFKEGQQVRAGQWLAQIDPRAFQAALDQAEGGLARDKAQLENARIDLERYRGLLAKDAIPKQQLDTQVALVRQLEGTVQADQGVVASARVQLSYTRITAPIAGRVGLKQVDLGNVVQPGDASGIISITQTQPISLVFAVPATHLPLITARLRAHAPIPVEAWDRGGKKQLAAGRVATVDNAIDPSTDTIKVKAVFPNVDDALFPNQAVSVTLQLDVLSDVIAVPQAAVLRGAQGFYVYVVNADNTVATRVVKPGPVDEGWMAVEGALKPDDKVVVDGTDRLREGAKVELIAADPKQRTGANAPAGGGPRHGRESRDNPPGR